MRSDDELDKETDRFVTRLWVLGIIIMLVAGAGVFAAIEYKNNQNHKAFMEEQSQLQKKLASDTNHRTSASYEADIDYKISAELVRHNFPIEHPHYHIEEKDGVEYWYCDEEYCWFYVVIINDKIWDHGHAHWPCNTSVADAEAALNGGK